MGLSSGINPTTPDIEADALLSIYIRSRFISTTKDTHYVFLFSDCRLENSCNNICK